MKNSSSTPQSKADKSAGFTSPSDYVEPQVIKDTLQYIDLPEVRNVLLPEIRELCAYERTVGSKEGYNFIILTKDDRETIIKACEAYDHQLEETRPLINKCNDLLGFGEGERKNISELEEHFFLDPSNHEAMNKYTGAISRIKNSETELDNLLISQKVCERFVTNYAQIAHLLSQTGWENAWINTIYSIIPAAFPLVPTPSQTDRATPAQLAGSMSPPHASPLDSSSTGLLSALSLTGYSTPLSQQNVLSSASSAPTTPFSTPLVSSSKAAANRFLEEAARTKQDESKQR